jgi:hypothetical protein
MTFEALVAVNGYAMIFEANITVYIIAYVMTFETLMR